MAYSWAGRALAPAIPVPLQIGPTSSGGKRDRCAPDHIMLTRDWRPFLPAQRDAGMRAAAAAEEAAAAAEGDTVGVAGGVLGAGDDACASM